MRASLLIFVSFLCIVAIRAEAPVSEEKLEEKEFASDSLFASLASKAVWMKDAAQSALTDNYIVERISEHPTAAKILAGGAAGAALVAATPVVLGAAGFTAGGIVGGSIAAGIQSAYYGGTIGTAFAAAQSIGAAGVGAASIAAGAGVGALVGSVVGDSQPCSSKECPGKGDL